MVSVEYHCEPANFEYQILYNEDLKLECKKRQDRISIYSSSIKSLLKNSEEDLLKMCDDLDVTHLMLRKCHGRKSCNVESEYFPLVATNCELDKYSLNITYSCIPEIVFNQEYLRKIDMIDSALKINKFPIEGSIKIAITFTASSRKESSENKNQNKELVLAKSNLVEIQDNVTEYYGEEAGVDLDFFNNIVHGFLILRQTLKVIEFSIHMIN